ncbi:unnamed protein product [Adineta steineri]|uniref:Uncharacterized protein n=1 Tax=Adineta steineri TaxID=433720 RepID=A0A814BJ50_9BILA|nr:unnamed protein product [Adineta steineri]CAF0928232.1 unnamed protein product [Adineta steineri]
MLSKNYLNVIFIYSIYCFYLTQCQITNEYNQLLSNELDYIDVKHVPTIIHNDNVYLPIIYKCSSLSRRRISLSIRIERTLYRSNFAVFRRHWFCQNTTQMKIRYIRVRLHRSLAYASDSQSNFQSLPIEQGQLHLIMYNNEQENENEILRKVLYNIRFLPVYKRPSIRSFRWNPLINKTIENICPKEPEIVRVINYPLVMTGNAYGKYFTLPQYQQYSLRLEQQMRLIRPKFSIIFWLYIDEYCTSEYFRNYCGILQHLTFNNTHLTPEIFLSQEGRIRINLYGSLYALEGTGAETIASVPRHDWCRVALIVDEYHWKIYINCVQTWDKPIIASHTSSIYYYSNDELGTFMVGGSDITHSFRGFISQMDIYRRIALTYEQLPKKLDMSSMPFLPSIVPQSNECKYYIHLFKQCYEQFILFNKRIQQKFTCNARPFVFNQSNQQCLLIRTWKQKLSSGDIRYRIFRALRRQIMNSTTDVANKLFDLTIKLLVKICLYFQLNIYIIGK